MSREKKTGVWEESKRIMKRSAHTCPWISLWSDLFFFFFFNETLNLESLEPQCGVNTCVKCVRKISRERCAVYTPRWLQWISSAVNGTQLQQFQKIKKIKKFKHSSPDYHHCKESHTTGRPVLARCALTGFDNMFLRAYSLHFSLRCWRR